MNRLYQDTMTDEMRHDLALHCYNQGFLDDEPSFGHYTPDLLFGQKEATPDDHYYKAQGQEPPPPKKYRQWFIRNFEVSIMLFFIALILVGLVFWPVN